MKAIHGHQQSHVLMLPTCLSDSSPKAFRFQAHVCKLNPCSWVFIKTFLPPTCSREQLFCSVQLACSRKRSLERYQESIKHTRLRSPANQENDPFDLCLTVDERHAKSETLTS